MLVPYNFGQVPHRDPWGLQSGLPVGPRCVWSVWSKGVWSQTLGQGLCGPKVTLPSFLLGQAPRVFPALMDMRDASDPVLLTSQTFPSSSPKTPSAMVYFSEARSC